jgi:ATP synthase F1 complex assembly factor 2
LKNHNIPLTSIVARVQDIIEAEARGKTKIRDIIAVMMRYLETDTLLCWVPDYTSDDTTALEMQSSEP